MKQFQIDWKWTTIGLATLIGIGYIANKGETGPKPEVISPDPATHATTKEDRYRQAFLEGCDTDGSMSGYCSCAWRELRTTMTVDEIAAMAQTYNQDNVYTREMLDAANACMDRL